MSYYEKRSGVVYDISPSFMKLLEMEPGKSDGFGSILSECFFSQMIILTIPQLVGALYARCLSSIQSFVHSFSRLWEGIERLSV